MNFNRLDENKITRAEFLRGLARWLALAGLAMLGSKLLPRRRTEKSPPPCDGICRGCPAAASCKLPGARSLRTHTNGK